MANAQKYTRAACGHLAAHYDPSERITGNNFDIGAYEQLGTAEKNEMFLEMGQAIREHGFTNYMDFYEFVVDTYEDMNYIEVMRCYSGHFERMTRGNYQRWEQGQRGLRPSQAQHHARLLPCVWVY